MYINVPLCQPILHFQYKHLLVLQMLQHSMIFLLDPEVDSLEIWVHQANTFHSSRRSRV